MNDLNDIVDRAIDYTHQVLRTMPSYRATAANGLRKLRDSLAAQAPEHPAIKRLDAFLESLNDARGA